MKKRSLEPLLLVMIVLFALPSRAVMAQSQGAHTNSQQHRDHHARMNERGDHAMGFAQDKTAHHFTLLQDGGVIAVSVLDANDTTSRDQIRMHLSHIATLFAEGDFQIPMFIHDQTPPGAKVMKEKRNQITYRYEESETGARVRLSTSDKKALAAIHDFLRFQIKEHKTGDSLAITRN